MTRYFFTFSLFFLLISGLKAQHIVFLHTNDTHSRIEPLPSTDKYNPELGGVVRRAAYIEKMRNENENVFLFDAGDFLQGTTYFNMFKGEVEVGAMNLLNYDAVTIGNHEFDYGMDVLAEVFKKATFPIVSTNYDFSNTEVADIVKPYLIIEKNDIKVGVVAANISPEGLIASSNYEGMKYIPYTDIINETAKMLHEEKKCDIVVCLSHLGIKNELELAENSRYIDIIIGGHSHTFMQEPMERKNLDNKEVTVFQTNGRGVFVGRIDIELEKVVEK